MIASREYVKDLLSKVLSKFHPKTLKRIEPITISFTWNNKAWSSSISTGVTVPRGQYIVHVIDSVANGYSGIAVINITGLSSVTYWKYGGDYAPFNTCEIATFDTDTLIYRSHYQAAGTYSHSVTVKFYKIGE